MLIVFTDVCKLRGGYRVAGQVAWCEAEQKGGIGRGGGHVSYRPATLQGKQDMH